MQTYSETKDPNETKDYSFDWSPQLATGEALTGQTLAFVDAAGVTSPSDSHLAGISTVWLAGGTAGGKVIYTLRVTTDGGRTLEESFTVAIVDTTYVAPEATETTIERLTREIAESKSQRALVARGEAVIDVWRDGRRVRRNVTTLKDLNDLIAVLEAELREAQVAEGIVPANRRRAIGTYF